MRQFVMSLPVVSAFAGLSAPSSAAEIAVFYEVYAMERPLYAVSVEKRGLITTDSLHADAQCAQSRAAKLERNGHTAWVRPIHYWKGRTIPEEAQFMAEFLTYADAERYADKLESNGMFAWIRRVEFVPGGP